MSASRLSAYLKSLRVKRGLTQLQVAEASNLYAKDVYAIESGSCLWSGATRFVLYGVGLGLDAEEMGKVMEYQGEIILDAPPHILKRTLSLERRTYQVGKWFDPASFNPDAPERAIMGAKVTWGGAMRDARQRATLTQQSLSNRIHLRQNVRINQSQVSLWERGKYVPKWGKRQEIYAVLEEAMSGKPSAVRRKKWERLAKGQIALQKGWQSGGWVDPAGERRSWGAADLGALYDRLR